MKTRRLADAAIVAALLLISMPDLVPEDVPTPEMLLNPPSVTQPADASAAGESSASRELS